MDLGHDQNKLILWTEQYNNKEPSPTLVIIVCVLILVYLKFVTVGTDA